MDTKLVDYLKTLSLFKGVPEEVLTQIAKQSVVRALAKGEVLVRRSDPSDSLFIIHSGWLKVITQGSDGQEIILNQCGPGQIIGEMSLIDRSTRSNTVTAVSSAQVLEIKYNIVLEVLAKHPVLAQSFLRNMSARLRFANAYIGQVIEWCQQIAAGNYDFVEQQLHQTQATIVDMGQSPEARANAFLSAFFQMVEDVKKREENLKQQLRQLTIQIDEAKKQQALQELTGTEFFEQLQTTAQELRARRQVKAAGSTGDEPKNKAKDE